MMRYEIFPVSLRSNLLMRLPAFSLLLTHLLFATAALAAETAPGQVGANHGIADHVVADHISVSLLSEHDALVPGTSAWFGLRLQHDAHWHSYWINPGDSGLPTRLTWQLPEGFSASEIAWPVPKRFNVGELFNFGYDGDMVLPVQIEVPATATGNTAHVEVQAKWLVCQEECIPGKATLGMDLPLRAVSVGSTAADAIDAARQRQAQHGLWKATAKLVDNRIEVTLRGANLGDGHDIDAFAVDSKVIANAPPRIEQRDGAIVLSFAKSDYFTSTPHALHLLVLPPGAPAVDVRAFFPTSS